MHVGLRTNWDGMGLERGTGSSILGQGETIDTFRCNSFTVENISGLKRERLFGKLLRVPVVRRYGVVVGFEWTMIIFVFDAALSGCI